MKSFIALSLTVALCAVMADPNNAEYPQRHQYPAQHYQAKQVQHYAQPAYQHHASQYQQHEAAPGPIATAEDFAKIRCFAAFQFFAWYCPDFSKFQNYKLDIKYPTENFWGKYQFEFDDFVAAGCKSKPHQDNFYSCLEQGAYLAKYATKPAVFNP